MTLPSILEEFIRVVDSIYGVYLDSTSGFSLVKKQMEDTQQSAIELFRSSNPELATIQYLDNAAIMYGKGDPSDAASVLLHRCTQGEFKARNQSGGVNFRFVANVCLVTLYQYWEDFFREEIARSAGMAKDEVVSDVMGDIRYLRHSIIHNRGVAVSEVERCKVLKWFAPGETIYLDEGQFETLILEVKAFVFGFAELVGDSEPSA